MSTWPSQETLDDYGRQGWELVSCGQTNDGAYPRPVNAIFKRPKVYYTEDD